MFSVYNRIDVRRSCLDYKFQHSIKNIKDAYDTSIVDFIIKYHSKT